MSNSPSRTKVSLHVRAPEQSTEIFVMDGRFRRVASGLGHLETSVFPGVYKVRFRSGTKQRDKLVEIRPDQTIVNVTTEPLGFSSAAPISNTFTSREYHQATAAEQSSQVHMSAGAGSQLYLYVRDLLDEQDDFPWIGVSLHDLEGNPIADLTNGVCDEEHRFGALNLELDPGTYRLRVESGPMGVFEMFLITSEGWQTQVFLLAADFQASEGKVRRAALKTAAVFMCRIGKGFHPDNEKFRLAELARQGLVTGRNVVDRNTLNELLWGKYENPMMGIYGAHLLIQSYRPNHELIDEVISNLGSLLGSHTDVEALRLRSGTRSTSDRLEFSSPPMLRSSWELIVKQSLKRLDTVPMGSIAADLADGFMSSTPWLLHRVPEVHLEERPADEMNFAGTQRMLEQMVTYGEGEGREVLMQASRDRSAFSPLELQIMNAMLNVASAKEFSRKYTGESKSVDKSSVPQLIRSLNAPSVSIAQSTINLAQKLGLEALKTQG